MTGKGPVWSKLRKSLGECFVLLDIRIVRPIQGLYLKRIYFNDSNSRENMIGKASMQDVDEIRRPESRELAKNGFLILDCHESRHKINALKPRVSDFFSVSSDVNGHGNYVDVPDAIKKFPEITTFLTRNLTEILDSYYKNGFTILDYRIWRNYYWENPHIDVNSNIWHFDQCRTDVLKIFFVICNTSNDAAAGGTHLKSIADTRDIVAAGFFSRWWISGKARSLLDNRATTVKCPAVEGSCYIFNPQLCIHKATTVDVNSYRDVLVLQVAGSARP